MNSPESRKLIGVCEGQPVTAEGVRALLGRTRHFECHWTVTSMAVCMEMLRRQPVDVVLLDKGLGFHALIEKLPAIARIGPGAIPVVWGTSISESEALRLFQAGAKGVMKKSADAGVIVNCFATVAAGKAWMDEDALRNPSRSNRQRPTTLTSREQQVLELVEQGMKNREIAGELGIRPGTVKIHLRHIFEKTGIHGRFGLALNGIRSTSRAVEPPDAQEIDVALATWNPSDPSAAA